MRNKLALIIALASFAVGRRRWASAWPAPTRLGGTRQRRRRRRPPPPPVPRRCRRPPARTGSTTTATAWSTSKTPTAPNPADPERGARSRAADRPKPAPSPTPAPRPSPPSRPDEPSGGVEAGTTIDGRSARRQGGVTRNQGLGDASGGGGDRRRRHAPRSATGGGDQPPATGADGGSPPSTTAAPRPRPTRRRRSPPSARPRSASPTSSSTPSRSRPSCCRSTRPAAPSTGSPGRCSPRSTKSRPRFGTNLNVSSAGAMGWMQFLPSSWETYGLDANGDGRKDPYNPVDAICAAAHYLKVAGGDRRPLRRDLRLQPRRLVRAGGAALRPRLRQAADRPGRLADRPDRGRPLPGRRRRPLRRRHLDPRGAEAGDARGSATTTATPPK